jgi:hypothetical protein
VTVAELDTFIEALTLARDAAIAAFMIEPALLEVAQA